MITDTVKIALIISIAPTVTALGALIASLRNLHYIGRVEKSINGLQDQLVETTRKEAFAAGRVEEKKNPT